MRRITPEDIKMHGVVNAPDKLQGTANENKMIFDRLIREVVAGAINAVIDRFEEFQGEEQIRDQAEKDRQEAEAARQEAEDLRQNTFRQEVEEARGYKEEAEEAANRVGNTADDSEAWAVGQRNGVDVSSLDPAYRNNAKFYKDQAKAIVGGDDVFVFHSIVVPQELWTASLQHEDFPWEATVAAKDVTEQHVPFVVFDHVDAATYGLATVADTGEGTLTIYSVTKPTATFTIPATVFMAENVIPGKEALRQALEEALQKAVESGEFDGPPGPKGPAGEDGVSPVATVEAITGGHRVTITDAEGSKSFDVMNGKDGSGTGGGSGGGVSKASELDNDVPFVSAGDAQALTDAQKEQARVNIGASHIRVESTNIGGDTVIQIVVTDADGTVSRFNPKGSDGGVWVPEYNEETGVIEWEYHKAGDFYPVPSPVPTGIPVPTTASVGQTIVVSEVDKNGKPTKWEARDAGASGGASVEPAEDDIPKVYFTGTLPTSKAQEDVRLTMHYRSKTADFIYPVTLKVQGSSSANYAKKNFTLKPYKDDTYEKKQKLTFKNWPEMNKFVLKAHWIDHSHVRNVGTAKLWGKLVASRPDYNSLPEELRNSPNNGATDGFTVKVFANGVYQGLYEWIVAKDKLFGQDSDIATHSILNSELNNQPTCAFATTSPTMSGNWSEELHDSMSPAISTSFANLIKFVAGSTDEEFVANAENYFDVQSVIDYNIFARIFCIVDNLCRNQIFFTYDGVKWYEGVWDLDATLGLPPTVRGFYAYNTDFQTGYIAYTDYGVTNLLYQRVENLFLERFKARYAELRAGVLSVDNIIDVYERLTDTITTYDGLLEEDYATTTGGGAFTGIPYTSENNIQQIRNFAAQRTEYMDVVVENMTGESGGESGGEPDDGGDDYEPVNILDSVAWELGMINGINGSDIANLEWIRTAYFDFSDYAGAMAGVTTNEAPTARFAVYNADKTNLHAVYDDTGTKTAQCFIVAEAAKYARVSAMIKNGTAIKEDTVSLYVAANANVLDSVEEATGKVYSPVSGELQDNPVYNAKRIDVNSAVCLFVNAESVVFQGEDGSLLGANTTVQYKDTLLRLPAGTKYVCVNYRADKSTSVWVRKAVEIGRRQINGNDW